jgi:hypothetical protein
MFALANAKDSRVRHQVSSACLCGKYTTTYGCHCFIQVFSFVKSLTMPSSVSVTSVTELLAGQRNGLSPTLEPAMSI